MKGKILFKISILIFALSIIIISFSLYEIISSNIEVKNTISAWDTSEIIKNTNISPSTKDSIKGSETNENKSQPLNKIDISGIIGKLSINGSENYVPIVEGTEISDLKKGAGHYIKSSMPGDMGNCLIFGHRDGVFRILKDIKIDDIIFIETNKDTFKYEVTNTQILLPNNVDIIKSYNEPILTLVTCYPFYYIGPAPKRFIVTARLINIP